MQKLFKRQYLIPVFIIISTITGILYAHFANPQGRAPISFDLQEINLEEHHRIMVFAPHCDDEILGAGGLIQLALRNRSEIIVVLETNGDGYLFATMDEFRRLYPRPSDYIKMGNIRQQETLNALESLGVPADQVFFLGYPDRGTPALWLRNWSGDRPYLSPYTRAFRSPYQQTFDREAVYAGQDLLSNIRTLLEIYRPDMIVYPHPADVHPDHWGLSVFVRLAVYLMQREHIDYEPAMYAYLIHRPDFPLPKGYHPDSDLLPPLKLWGIDVNWNRVDLPEEAVKAKEEAIMKYKSQLPLLKSFLLSFIRTNELFDQPTPVNLENIVDGDRMRPESWVSEAGEEVLPVQEDPVGDLVTRKITPATDFVALYAARSRDNELWLCGKLHGKINPIFTYNINLLAVDGHGVEHYFFRNKNLSPGVSQAFLGGNEVCAQISMGAIGNPWLIMLNADVNNGGMGLLDQTAWQSIFVDSSLSAP